MFAMIYKIEVVTLSNYLFKKINYKDKELKGIVYVHCLLFANTHFKIPIIQDYIYRFKGLK